MNRSILKLLQKKLAASGDYAGAIDGISGPITNAAVESALRGRASSLPDGWVAWPAKRKAVAMLQLLCREGGFDTGPIDGWWGPQTQFAVDSLQTLDATGSAPPPWRDRPAARVNSNGWPPEDEAAMNAFFGPHGLPDGRSPGLTSVECPWTLRLAWNRSATTRRIGCNTKVADSLGRVLTRVWETYGETEIRRLRLDTYGGCYAARRKRGGTSWSTHAWAIALDWDPDNNQLRWGRDRATLARPEYDEWWSIWESEGWLSLGREKNFDWMHVQATAS